MKNILISTFDISLEFTEKKILITSKIDINDCEVKIYELSSNLIIYSTFFDFIRNGIYWIQIGPEFNVLNGIKVSIFQNENIIYQEEIELNRGINYSYIYDVIYSDFEQNCWAPFWEIFIKKAYEYKDFKVKKGDIVVDLGANIGLFSLYSIINGASKVYSVEALTDTYNFLVHNIKNFNIEASNYAISNDEHKEFFVNHRSGSSSFFNKSDKIESVKCLTFEKFINKNNINHIDFLKIDIEGSEYELFDTIDENYLKNNINIIFLEFHIVDNYNIQFIINKLENNGYKCIITEENVIGGMMIAINKKENYERVI